MVDPTLSRIESRLFGLVLLISIILFLLLGSVFWKLRMIAATGSETVTNVMDTIKSLESVLEKIEKRA